MTSQNGQRQNHPAVIGFAFVCGLCVLAFPGCGAERYKSRLNRTVEYFEYLDELNRNLAAKDGWQEKGIEFRVPKQFDSVPIPDPVAEPPEEADHPTGSPNRSGGTASDGFLVGSLPGLAGVWTAQVGVEAAEEDRPAYIYVLSNYDLWRQGDDEAALQFHETAVFDLTSALGISPPSEDRWTDETLPHGQAYVNKKSFLVTAPPLTTELHGLEYEVTIYLHETGDIQVVIAFVVPQDWNRGEYLDKRIPLSLETLSVSDEKPSPAEGESHSHEGDVDF